MIRKVIKYLKQLCVSCYSHIKIGRVDNHSVVSGVKRMETKGIMDARKLACYIMDDYKQNSDNSGDISSIKLQKALYFLFAFWGGFIQKSEDGQVEEDYKKYNKYLFYNRIEAWTYGPVIPDVYYAIKNGEITKYRSKNPLHEIFCDDEFIYDNINSILKDIYEISDFKLVAISHDDECWKNKYKNNDQKHNKEISKEEIVKEYAVR